MRIEAVSYHTLPVTGNMNDSAVQRVAKACKEFSKYSCTALLVSADSTVLVVWPRAEGV